MADNWVTSTAVELERWTEKHAEYADAGVDAGGMRILLELAAEALELGSAIELTPEGLRRLLLDVFPGAVVVEPEDAPSVLATAGALVDFLAETAGIEHRAAERLRVELTRIEPEFAAAIAAAEEGNEMSAAAVLAQLMHGDGVDLSDEAAVEQWSAEFNALPEEVRLTRVSEQLSDLEDAVVPPVRLAPADERAAQARASALSAQVRELTGWVGERALTETGELSSRDAAAAVAKLELNTPRSQDRESAGMSEITELAQLWRAAVAAEVLVVEAGRTRPGPALKVFESDDDEAVLAVWLAAFDAAITPVGVDSEQPIGSFEIVRASLPGVLIQLYEQREPAIREELFEVLFEHIEEAYEADDPGMLEVACEHALDLEIEDLVAWDVVAIDDEGGHTLTPLGVWGVRELLLANGYAAPLIGDLAGEPAAAFLDGLTAYGEDTADEEIDLWLARRDPVEAAAELLAVMRDGSPGRRGLGATVLHRAGPAAEPVVRGALEDSHTGPYARLWLHAHGRGEQPSPHEMMWIFADSVAGLLEMADPREAADIALADAPREEFAEMVGEMWRVDHPDIARVLEVLGDHHPDESVATAARRSLEARSM